MVYRNPKLFDGTIAGYQFRLKRDAEKPYIKQFVRSQVPFNQIEEQQSQFNSRQDIRTMHQTSWADGSFWNKPLLNAASINSYFTADGLDVVNVPGDVVPLGTVTAATGESSALYHPNTAISVAGRIYAVRDAGSFTGIRQWTGSAWANFSTNYNGADSNTPVVLFHDQANDNLIQLAADGNVYEMSRGDSSDSTIIDAGTIYEGANAFMHFGRMFVYTGEKLVEVTDPYGSPAVADIYDDGLGPDYLDNVSTSAAVNDRLIQYARLAVSTAEGIYIVKNVEQEGLPTAFIYRVDRSNNGTDIGSPIGTLPPGMVALDVMYHLGSLLISATSDVDVVMNNDLTDSVYPRVDIHFVSPAAGLGTIGSPLGGDSPDEAPFKFAGTFGAKVYLGGQKRVWVYDAIRGGLHPLFDHFQSGAFGAAVGRAFDTTDSSGNRVLRFFDSEMNYFDMELTTGTDNDSQTRELESNYFAFNIPAEQKTVTHVTLMTDGVNANETWTIQLSTDDGAFSTVATHTDANTNTEKQRITPATGYRFRYKLLYATTAAQSAPSRVKGIVFHALQGELVAQWRIVIDGKEFRNIENQVVHPDTVLSNMETVAVDETVQTFVDEFKTTSSTHNVKVQSVSVNRSGSAEIDSIEVVLVEDT